MSQSVSAIASAQVEAVRGFNRFYAQRIGVLAPYLDNGLSLTQARVLHELAHRDQPTAAKLGRDLTLDAGYMSRILRSFETRGWLARSASPSDARQSLLKLTRKGRRILAPLEQRAHAEAAALLSAVPAQARGRLIEAMQTLQQLLEGPPQPLPARAVVLRDPRPGDLGWVVQQHGEIYWKEYRYTNKFEGLVAEIAARFIKNFDPAFEKGWIAEIDGERVGSVFVVRRSATVAQLRLLILTSGARGLGLGGRLTDEYIRFAHGQGYRKIMLWTNANLHMARIIYKSRGFRLTKSEPFHAHGQDLVNESWELKL